MDVVVLVQSTFYHSKLLGKSLPLPELRHAATAEDKNLTEQPSKLYFSNYLWASCVDRKLGKILQNGSAMMVT